MVDVTPPGRPVAPVASGGKDQVAEAGWRVPGVQARRVIFIDLARALAVVFMVYGHTIDALLAPQYRHGLVYDAWQFQRGLTSSLFLLLSGFAFSVATVRHWSAHLAPSPALLRRVRRFALFIVLGYLLHLPVSPFWRLAGAGPEVWRAWLSADVLHVIGVTFLGVQGLVLVTRTPRRFAAAALLLAGGLVLAAPAVWQTSWEGRVPMVLAAYLTPATGSLFPVVPWSAFVLLGAALGQVYAHRGAANLARFANLGLLAPGVALCLLSAALMAGQDLFGQNPHTYVPGNMTVRAGACLLILGVLAHVSRRVTRLPHLFGAVAQESLAIYVVHIAIVYGSLWNPGLVRVFALRLGPWALAPIVLTLLAAMAALAWVWNHWKHTRPALVRRLTTVLLVLMLVRLWF